MSSSTNCKYRPLKQAAGAFFICLACSALPAKAQPLALSYKLSGDVGGAAFRSESAIRGLNNRNTVLPYVFADYGPFFARIDTVGLKVLPIGSGHVELVGRVSLEGWRANTAALAGLKDRKTPLPVGVGTFQQTSYGAFVFNAFFDAGPSRGSLLEATYLAEVKLGGLTLYPQLGLESRSANYANYLYGVTPAESLASGYAAYQATASTVGVLGLAGDYALTQDWVVNLQLRRKWLDAAVTSSPLVARKTQDMGYVGLSYRFR